MLPFVQKTDTEIKRQVSQELQWDCRTETSPITISVLDGVVTLGGRVKYYAIKHAAVEAAHRIAGVTSVHDEIEIKTPFHEFRADYEIAEATTQAFQWNVLVPHEQISVMVDSGIVNLYGTVDCITQREEAERAVINLLGVRGIVNRLAVKAQPVKKELVCAEIMSTLERQAVTNADQVTVDMKENTIRLSGKVPSWNDRCAVITAASFAHGVRQVVDDLQIAVSA